MSSGNPVRGAIRGGGYCWATGFSAKPTLVKLGYQHDGTS